MSLEETTPEGHALMRPVYKVELHPPGAAVSPSGLPLFDLVYRNDDGGPMYGKDSRVTSRPRLRAPISSVSPTRAAPAAPAMPTGSRVAAPEPDYDLFVTPSNPNVRAAGGYR